MAEIPHTLLSFAGRAEWRAWLEEHHSTEREAWVLHYKVNAPQRGMAYEEAVEEALCFGWIDGLLRSVDAQRYALRYSPRKRRSVWSQSNKLRVERLMEQGRMTAAGLEKVAEAKANGEWDAATAREDVSTIPADLAQELEQHGARESFDNWPSSRKKQYLFWLSSARRPVTRQKRIAAIVALAASEPRK